MLDIRAEIQAFLEQTGWSASKLAREAGVTSPTLTRFLKGTRAGLHTKTLEKLWPIISGNGHKGKENTANLDTKR